MAHPSTTTSTVGQTKSTPSVRKAGTYQVLPSPEPNGDWRAFVYRNGAVVTQTRAATKSAAVSEARRNVRTARKAGGL